MNRNTRYEFRATVTLAKGITVESASTDDATVLVDAHDPQVIHLCWLSTTGEHALGDVHRTLQKSLKVAPGAYRIDVLVHPQTGPYELLERWKNPDLTRRPLKKAKQTEFAF